MRAPRKAVRIGVPILVVGLLAIVALWRVGLPVDGGSAPPAGAPRAIEPLTRIADVFAANSIGRTASLEQVTVREVLSPRAAWIDARAVDQPGVEDEPLFAVLDPDIRMSQDVVWRAGTRATLIGLVRPAPAPQTAVRQWSIDPATAETLATRGTYLHVTEVR